MLHCNRSVENVLAMLVVVLILMTAAAPVQADKSAVKMTKLDGMVDLSAVGPSPYALKGIASHLGNFQAYGEVEFGPGDEEGSMIGTGPVVFKASNGDRLVGVATWTVDPSDDGLSEADVHFGWRDSVAFSDGTVASNTGRFVKARPPGLVVVVSTEEQTRENVVTLDHQDHPWTLAANTVDAAPRTDNRLHFTVTGWIHGSVCER